MKELVKSADNTLESVRKDHEGLQSFHSMRRMEASLRKASAFRLRFSQSLARRRQRFSQPMVRSMIQCEKASKRDLLPKHIQLLEISEKRIRKVGFRSAPMGTPP